MTEKRSFFQNIRDKKRSRNEINEALSTLLNLSLEDMEYSFTCSVQLEQTHMLALLVLRFGVMSLFLARYAIKNIPMVLPVDMKKKILQAIFPSLATAEVNFLIRNLPRVSDFMDDATLEDKINHACSSTGIPFCDILCPPVENCTNCGRRLTLHNQPAHITIFKIAGRVQGIKITSKCQPCGLIYKYAQHGNENDVGYQFYQERRSLVEASNVAYFERQLCLYQVFLRYVYLKLSCNLKYI